MFSRIYRAFSPLNISLPFSLLLTTGIHVDHVNQLGWTALLEAVILGDGGPAHREIVQMLLAAKANVNLPDGQGVTPLQHALARQQTQVVAMLRADGSI